MKAVAVIPVRYNSSRFPGKPLQKIENKTLVNLVYEKAINSNLFEQVIVATDDQRIFDVAQNFGAKVVKSSKVFSCGTERVADVAKKIEADVFVNIQGDEPFITAKSLSQLLVAIKGDCDIATLAHKIEEKRQINDFNAVKVIYDKEFNAIYFSRFPIPFIRDKNKFTFFKHIGVYAYKKKTLLSYEKLPSSSIEKCEKLEQLRYLYNGIKIKVVPTEKIGISIDCKDDFVHLKKMLDTKR